MAWPGMMCVCSQQEVVSHVLDWFLEEGFEVMLEEQLLMDICEGLEAWPDSVHNGLHEGTRYPPALIQLAFLTQPHNGLSNTLNLF